MFAKVKETKTKEVWTYDTNLEREDHIHSYGLFHVITKIYGDGKKKPLTVEYEKKRRNLLKKD